MALARSKVTAQGQISVPAGIRKRLGITPGSILEWEEEGEKIVVRRAGRYSSEDIHRALFPNGPPEPRTIDEMKAGIFDSECCMDLQELQVRVADPWSIQNQKGERRILQQDGEQVASVK